MMMALCDDEATQLAAVQEALADARDNYSCATAFDDEDERIEALLAYEAVQWEAHALVTRIWQRLSREFDQQLVAWQESAAGQMAEQTIDRWDEMATTLATLDNVYPESDMEQHEVALQAMASR